MSARRGAIAAALLLAAAAAALRLVRLGSDPAPSLAADFLTDEGWWCHNARQTVLFGRPVLDDFNQALHGAPLHNALLTLAFGWAGVSWAAARTVSALAGLVAVAALAAAARRLGGRGAALPAAAILGLSAPAVLHDRTAFVEPVIVMTASLAAAACAEAMRRRGSEFDAEAPAAAAPRPASVVAAGAESASTKAIRRGAWLAAAGAAAALAAWTKANAIYVLGLPAAVALGAWTGFRAPGGAGGSGPLRTPAGAAGAPGPLSRGPGRGRAALRDPLLVGAGFLLVSAAAAWWVVGPDAAGWAFTNRWLGRVYAGLGIEALPLAVLSFPRQELWGDLAPVAAPAFGLLLMSAAGDGRLKGGPLVRLGCIWLGLGAATTMIFRYQPDRRILTLLPPLAMILAAALAARRGAEGDGGGGPWWEAARGPRRWAAAALVLWPVASIALGAVTAIIAKARGAPLRWVVTADVGYRTATLLLAALLLASGLAAAGGGEVFRRRLGAAISVAGVYPAWLWGRWILRRLVEFGALERSAQLAADVLAAAAIPIVLLVVRAARRREFAGGAGPGLAAPREAGGAPRAGAEGSPPPHPLREARPAVSPAPRWAHALTAPKVFVALFAIGNAPSLLALARPTDSIREAGARIAAALPEGAVLLGSFSDTLGLETRLRTFDSRPHYGLNPDPYGRWPGAVLVTAPHHPHGDGDHVPPWAPPDLEPLMDLPLCPNPWTGEPRFVLRLRAPRNLVLRHARD